MRRLRRVDTRRQQMSALGTLARMGPRAWLLALRVLVTAVAVEVTVRTRPLPAAARLAGATLTFGAPPEGSPDGWTVLSPAERHRCDVALRVLARRPLRATCLRRSLVLATLLRRRRPLLRVGVAKQDGAVAAHAWIEVDGASLDPQGDDYSVLRPPSAIGRAT